jgi:hypothetical protein
MAKVAKLWLAKLCRAQITLNALGPNMAISWSEKPSRQKAPWTKRSVRDSRRSSISQASSTLVL